MRRRWLMAGVLGACCAIGLVAWLTSTTGAQDPGQGTGRRRQAE